MKTLEDLVIVTESGMAIIPAGSIINEFNFKKEHKSEKGGLTDKGRKAYNKATGSDLKAPQPQGGKRKNSFCSRMTGQKKMHNIDCRENPDKRICKSLKRWKCNEDKIPGGLADDLTIDDIVKKHYGDKKGGKEKILKQLEMGIEVEGEHTDDDDIAREIALDHLSEKNPKYYTDLKSIENH